MKGMKRAVLVGCVIALSGCAGIKEGARGIAGISTKILEDTRVDAIKKSFSYDHATCYDKTVAVLKKIEAYIYAQPAHKQMIAVYISDQDTTPVGLFFREIESGKTQIEVSSPSSYGKELIANKVFSELGKKPAPPAEK